jgi:hypothetical protein
MRRSLWMNKDPWWLRVIHHAVHNVQHCSSGPWTIFRCRYWTGCSCTWRLRRCQAISCLRGSHFYSWSKPHTHPTTTSGEGSHSKPGCLLITFFQHLGWRRVLGFQGKKYDNVAENLRNVLVRNPQYMYLYSLV